ncbi:hypothetical protein M2397_002006 [Pseudomonas sp. BIGb0381]|uniref:hypothetical protein n=1 Tax=Pseudomonas sp. BIGb0381 TaxID=2940608 RepID=UPI002168308C|nr:hypothetical protein [Pseudomonas sp. BIGb0381]MCS4311711.1 hypothetical protein [Pseudomonas sp. BIGb0381]
MHQKPNIFLIDTDKGIHDALKKKWTNIGVGTLGTPYEVPINSTWRPVVQHKKLIQFQESDLIVVDLTSRVLAPESKGGKHTPQEEIDLWAKCDKGWIDARARTALFAKADFNRIVASGGALIVFAGPESPMEFQWASANHHSLETSKEINGGVWNLIDSMEKIRFISESGSVINVTSDEPLEKLLKKYLQGAEFKCVFKPRWSKYEFWRPLATNKYGADIALSGHYGDGIVLIFPQILDKASFISELLESYLPERLPNLFPDIEKGKWTHFPEYELERVIELEERKALVITEMEKELHAIDEEISMNRSEDGWIHDLITATGDGLVNAIKLALSELGFESIVDVDEIRDAEGKSRREDLRIEDRNPTLVIDIKGVGGKASDDDLMQANKHALINMKELKITTIQGLSIINQQRHLPPLLRDNSEPFRQEILDFADETGLGLLTTFDLYRIVLNKRRHGWISDWVKPILYKHQRITPIPEHYQYIGAVSKVFSEVFGMHILENRVEVGDFLAVEGDIYFEEVKVDSIQVNSVDVESATVGDPAGFKWPSNAMKLREGMRVYALPKAILRLKAQP